MSKRVTIESGADPRVFSNKYADVLRIYVDDQCVYDSTSKSESERMRDALEWALDHCRDWRTFCTGQDSEAIEQFDAKFAKAEEALAQTVEKGGK